MPSISDQGSAPDPGLAPTLPHSSATSRPPRLTAPVDESQRLSSVDTLRGVALLGILTMNIVAFGLPGITYLNPAADAARPYTGPFTGLNYAAWLITHIFFDTKMMTIFSMLFGAGLILMDQRARRASEGGVSPTEPTSQLQIPTTPDDTTARDLPAQPAPFAGLYYRRLLWLLLLGMLHAYLLWFGDILTTYAICGLLLYPARRWRPRTLIIVGSIIMLVAPIISAGQGGLFYWMRDEARAAQAVLDAGGTPSDHQQEMLKSWEDTRQNLDPTPQKVAEEVARWRGGPRSVLRVNAESTFFMQTYLFLLFSLWRVLGQMMIGMALMKRAVFSAQRSTRFYTSLALLGYGIGFPLIALGVLDLNAHHHDVARLFLVSGHFNYVGSLAVALGHVGVVMLLCKSGALPKLRARLAAVGRMAFTNYLMHSVICTTLFFGWGFGLYGRLDRAQLVLVVLAIWFIQLVISPWWLARYRFGPAEWVWRSLTYWRVQPMRRASALPSNSR